MCVRWYLIIVLICVSLMFGNVEHLFMCLLAIHLSSWEKYLFKFFDHFWIELFHFWLLSFGRYLYSQDINLLLNIWFMHFFPFCGLPSYFIDSVFIDTNLNFFREVQFVYFSFCCLYLRCHIWEIIAKSNAMKILPYVFF